MKAKDSQIYSLAGEEVHIWLAEPEQCRQPELIETYLSWLDEQERSRYERFHFSRHRHEYLVAHALLRSSLSHYGNCSPSEWQFSKNTYGRPEIREGSGLPPLRFNLTHTEGLVACAITPSAAIGIDVERITRSGDLQAIADVSLSPAERADLHKLSGQEWNQHFFRLWTLKEAYIKAQGKGLSMPLQQITFQLSQKPSSIQFNFSSETERSHNWQFALSNFTSGHCLALAVHLNKLHLRTRWAIPALSYQHAIVPYVYNQ